MSKGNWAFDIEERMIDCDVYIILTVKTLPKTKIGNHSPKNKTS